MPITTHDLTCKSPSGVRLTRKEEKFCHEYIKTNGNGTQAVNNAGYKTKSDGVSTVIAYENLRKPHLKEMIRYLLDTVYLSAEGVDLKLKEHILNKTDRAASLKGIDIYNRLAGRYIEKHAHLIQSTDGTPIEEIEVIAPGN